MNEQKDTQINVFGIDDWIELTASGAVTELFVHPTGTSMLPLIRGGKDDVVVLPVKRPLKKGDIVLFRRFDGKHVLHRIWKIKGSSFVTFGDGSILPDAPIKEADILGIAVTLFKNGRAINLDTGVSRLRGRIWLAIFPVRYFCRRVIRKLKNL